ncbi:hypothetical protein PFISCL1PPCAC_14315, partial [Pristionchus fissidentatus]
IQVNSDVASATCFTGATICAMCYILIFTRMSFRPLRTWKQDVPLLITSFFLFLALCILSMFFFTNRFWVGINWSTLFYLRKHFYIVSFPLALINP